MTTAIKVGDKSVECALEDETRLRELRDETRWNREYALWKKTTAYLYDNVLVHALEWPSLTVQWLPGARPSAGGAAEDWTTHSLLLANLNGELNVLVPVLAPCRPQVGAEPFGTTLVLDRSDEDWATSLSSR